MEQCRKTSNRTQLYEKKERKIHFLIIDYKKKLIIRGQVYKRTSSQMRIKGKGEKIRRVLHLVLTVW